MNRKNLIVFLLIGLTAVVHGQGSDFGIWSAVSGSYGLDKHLQANFSLSLRTFENTSRTDQYFAEPGLRYRFNKYISAEASFRMINKVETDDQFHFRHKVFLGATGELPLKRFAISGRLLYERVVKTYIENDNDLIPAQYGRFRLKAQYSVPTSPFAPYVSLEPFIPVSGGNAFSIRKTRYSAGMEIKLTSHSSFQGCYLYENVTKATKTDMHILSLEYSFKF